jgi:predicted lipoprotein with Yx(FWY)xxD motif
MINNVQRKFYLEEKMNEKSPLKHTLKPAWWMGVLTLFVLLLAACAPAATPAPTETSMPAATSAPTIAPTMAPSATPAPTTPPEAQLNVATDAKLGKILTGANGMTLYMYAKDTPDTSTCTGNCLKSWPPLITQGSPKIGDGVTASLVGSTTLADGSKIVTYNKMPLYYFAKDAKAGDTTGQDVNNVWFVVSPDGKAVGMPAPDVTLNIATDAKLGKILVGDNGMTLYMYAKDAPNKANCAGNCLKSWPPFLTAGSPKAGNGVDASLIGTATLADGSKIVTYDKMPLYYWNKDTKPGDTTGQGVGEVWYTVSPDGQPNGMPAPDITLNVVDDPKLGKILVGDNNMTLYMFAKDDANTSNCSANCLKSWPPLLTKTSAKAGDGVDPALIGKATLADGTNIVTYNKMPLYYFAKDAKAGDTTGQDVNGVWYTVSPDGKPVGMPAPDVSLGVATDPTLGTFLVDGKGMTLYIFTNDEPNKSNCNASCLSAWPPLLTKTSAMAAGTGVTNSLIGTATLADGTKIVTYNKMPLYYWAGDTKPGDANGQGLNDVWYVIGPDGKPIKPATTSSTGY